MFRVVPSASALHICVANWYYIISKLEMKQVLFGVNVKVLGNIYALASAIEKVKLLMKYP